MLTRRIRAAALLLWSLALFLADDARGDTFRGTVRDEARRPVAGCSVRLAVAGVSARTDSSGAFAIAVDAGNAFPIEHSVAELPAFIGGRVLYFTVDGRPANVKVDVYTILGNHVSNALDGHLSPGVHNVDPLKGVSPNLATSVYLVRLEIGEQTKMLRIPKVPHQPVGFGERQIQQDAALVTAEHSRALPRPTTATDTIVIAKPGFWSSRIAVSRLPDTAVSMALYHRSPVAFPADTLPARRPSRRAAKQAEATSEARLPPDYAGRKTTSPR